MQHKLKILLALVLLSSMRLEASPNLDKQYGFQNWVVAVLASPDEPIHSEQVEKELVSLIQKRRRFDYHLAESKELQKNLKEISGPANSGTLTEKFEVYRPTLQSLKDKGIDTAVLAELTRKENVFDLSLTLITTVSGEATAQAVKAIEQPFSKENFQAKTAEAFSDLIKGIPFDGAVLKREGYLVILDGGAGTFSPGMRLPTFTLEQQDGSLSFNETGQILIQKTEENLSFAKILVEKKPLEVLSGNKIRLADKLATQDIPELLQSVNDANRAPASEIVSDFEVSKGNIGRLGANFGMDMVQLRKVANSGAETSSNVFFPGALLEGELWFTNRWYMDTSVGLFMGQFANRTSGATSSQSSSLSSFRLQFGYRINVLAPEKGPVLYAKLGYGKQAYNLGETAPLKFNSVAFGGWLLTGGIRVPLEETSSIGAEINTLMFPSVAQSPTSYGPEQSNINSWDLVLKGTISLSSTLDLDGRFILRNSGSDFSGGTGGSSAIKQISQNSKIAQLGLSYYF